MGSVVVCPASSGVPHAPTLEARLDRGRGHPARRLHRSRGSPGHATASDRFPAAAPTGLQLGPALFQKFGQQDRNLLVEQWDILQRLTGAIERYVEARVQEQLGKKR